MAPRKSNTIRDYKISKVRSNWMEFYKNMLAAIKGKEEIIVKPEEFKQSMLFIEAMFKSAAENKTIELQ